jgi:hypothetical protein
MSDYIPGSDPLFDTFYKNIVYYVGAKTTSTPPEWTHIPQESFQGLATDFGAWTAAFDAFKLPHTMVQTAEKNRVRKVCKLHLREFVNRFLRYPPVTDEDRDNMGIPNRKGSRAPVKVPTTSPLLIIDTGTRGRIIIYYKDEHSKRRGKPKGVHGIEVRWAVLDHPPKSMDELIHSSFDTNPPLTLVFDEKDRGKHIYLSGCWEIEREGEKGPPSAIVEAVIP